MMARPLALIALVSVLTAGTTDAGVRGGRFVGEIDSTLGNSATAVLSFAAEGNARTEVQTIGGIPNGYPGTYVEFDFGAVSFWVGDFTGAPTFKAWGFCLFSFVSTYSLANNNQPAATGTLFRAGDSNIP